MRYFLILSMHDLILKFRILDLTIIAKTGLKCKSRIFWSPCIYFSVLNLPAVTWRCYSLTQGGTVSFESITSTIFSESIISMEDNHCNHFLIINYLIQSLFYVDQICQNNFKFQGMRRWIEGGLGILREAIWLTAV